MADFEKLVSVPQLNQAKLSDIWQKNVLDEPFDPAQIHHGTLEAWKRCKAYGIDPYGIKLDPARLTPVGLQQRLEQYAEMLRICEYHFTGIEQVMRTHSDRYMIMLADADGYILEMRFKGAGSECFIPGVCLLEQYFGNNGIGSVLVTGMPLAVIGAEHYLKLFHEWTCIGAPIKDKEGKVLAVINIATSNESASPYSFSMTVAIAKAVESQLIQNYCQLQLAEKSDILRNLVQEREIIFEAMSQGVIIVNQDNLVTFANGAAGNIFGMKAEEMPGKNIRLVTPGPFDRQLLANTVSTGLEYTNLEIKFNIQGREKIVLGNTSLVYDGQGSIAGAIGIYTDVTELRQKEAIIWEQEKLALVGQMAAGMAHEIRNPLTAVRGFTQLLRESTGLDETGRSYLTVIISEIDQANRFISSFLQLAKPQPGKLERVSINQLVMEIDGIYHSYPFIDQVSVELNLDPAEPMVLVDPEQIKQVLMNLCQNAFQAMEGGGILTLTTAYHPAKREVQVAVADSGIGIAPEVLSKIGTPFFTTKAESSGLGLSICYSIIGRYNGRFDVNSRPNAGTCFNFYLPVVPD